MPTRKVYIYREGDEIELEAEYTRDRFYPAARIGDPPGDPAEGGQVDDFEVTLDGKPFELTDDERTEIYDLLNDDPTGEYDE